MKVVQQPQKPLSGSNQIWAVTSNEQDMRPATSAYIPQRHISNSRTRQKVLISSIKWNIIKPDFWVRTYRIIFGMFNTLCKIIENRSFLLILQLSSFQSKKFLEKNSEVTWMVFCQKFLKNIFLIKNCQKATTIFYFWSFKSKK